METVDRGKVDIGQDIAVDHQKRACVPEIGEILNGPAGAQDSGFKARPNRDRVLLGFDKSLDPGMQVMGVDHHGLTAAIDQLADQALQQGAPVDGEKRLGGVVAVWPEARSESRCKNKGFHRLFKV